MNEKNNFEQGAVGAQAHLPEVSARGGAILPKPPYTIDTADRMLAIGMFIPAYLLTDSFGIFKNPLSFGYGATFAIFIYAGLVILYAKAKKAEIPKESIFWLLILLGTASSYSFVYNASLSAYIELFLKAGMFYFAGSIFAVLLKKNTSAFAVFDLFILLFNIPLRNLFAQWKALGESGEGNKPAKNIRYILVSILAGMPLILIVMFLLASADKNFNAIMVSLIDNVGEYIGIFIFSLPLSVYLFALLYGAANRRCIGNQSEEEIKKSMEKMAILPLISIYTVLGTVILLYLLFIAIQATYVFGAMQGVLPEEFTYSEYARRGFFELAAISIINILLIFGINIFAKKGRTKRGIDFFAVLISVLTLILIITAMAKMALYIEVYGLTPLRVVPTVFMIYLAFVFVLVIISRFKKFDPLPAAIYIFAFMFMCLALSDMDGRIAEYNLNAYRKGIISDYGKDIILNADVAAIPAIYEAWEQSTDANFKEELFVLASDTNIAQKVRYKEEEAVFALKYNSMIKEKSKNLIIKMGANQSFSP